MTHRRCSVALLVAAGVSLALAQQLPSEIPNGCPALAAGGTVAPNGCGVATATTAGGKVSFIVSVPPGNEGNAMLVVVYNSQAQTTGWSAGSNPCFDVRPPSGNRSAPYTWTGGRWTNKHTALSDAVVVDYAFVTQANAGQYVVYADASLQAGTTTLTFTVIAMIMPAAWGAVTAPYNVFASEAAPAVIKQAVMPAPTSIGSCSPWRGCFSVTATDTAASYALRRVVVTATVATGVGAFVVPAAPFTITLAGGWVAAVSGAPVVNAPGRSVTQTFDWVAPPGVMGQATVIQVQIPGDSATSFAWSANTDGPFIDMTVSYTLVEYPALGSGPAVSGTLWVPGQGVPIPQTTAVYMMTLPKMWSTVNFAGTLYDVADTPSVPNSLFTISFADAHRPSDPTSGASFVTWTPTPAPGSFANSQYWSNGFAVPGYLAPGAGFEQQRYLVRVQLSTSYDGVQVLYSLTASVATINGECQSYQDCMPASSSQHPSKATNREDDSANGNYMRFVHCAVVPTATPPGAPGISTRCVECLNDCGCGEGQYCSVDSATCNSGNSPPIQFVCDALSFKRYGLCVAKSTSVQSAQCRMDALSNSAWSSSSSWFGSATAIGALATVPAASTVDGSADDKDVIGNQMYGFCGEVRYFNGTGAGPYPSTYQKVVQAGAVRTVLWAGRCLNQVRPHPSCAWRLPRAPLPQVCTECGMNMGSPCGDRQCLNGAWRDRWAVDNTYRTFTKNTVAGTLLGLTFMVIFVQLCLLPVAFKSVKVLSARNQIPTAAQVVAGAAAACRACRVRCVGCCICVRGAFTAKAEFKPPTINPMRSSELPAMEPTRWEAIGPAGGARQAPPPPQQEL